MSNMSYCRFENTLRDLKECVWSLEDGEDIKELSTREMDAAIQMLETCREYLDLEHIIDEILNEQDK